MTGGREKDEKGKGKQRGKGGRGGIGRGMGEKEKGNTIIFRILRTTSREENFSHTKYMIQRYIDT